MALKRTSRQWYYKFHQVITSYGFEVNLIDDYIYQKLSGSTFIFLILYVDDILLANNDKAYCTKPIHFYRHIKKIL
ncbi:hypothetical protein CR513_50620, partial [Mucuna pruriens]